MRAVDPFPSPLAGRTTALGAVPTCLSLRGLSLVSPPTPVFRPDAQPLAYLSLIQKYHNFLKSNTWDSIT